MLGKKIILLGTPRSGTTLLFRTLSQHAQLWHLVAESHAILEGPLHPSNFTPFSNRPDEHFLWSPEVKDRLYQQFYQQAVNYSSLQSLKLQADFYKGPGRRYVNRAAAEAIGTYSKRHKPAQIAFLEKTPKNAVRVKWLQALFPDAVFVHLKRAAVPNIGSLYHGWRANDRLGKGKRGRYSKSGYAIVDQLDLKDFEGSHWSFVLPPHWERLRGRELLDVCIFQYFLADYWMTQDLKEVPSQQLIAIEHEHFIQNPVPTIERILDVANLPVDQYDYRYVEKMPRINNVAVGKEEKRQIFAKIENKLKTFDIKEYL